MCSSLQKSQLKMLLLLGLFLILLPHLVASLLMVLSLRYIFHPIVLPPCVNLSLISSILLKLTTQKVILGFPLLSRLPKHSDFNSIIQKNSSKLACWKSKLLNIAGRVTLAKSVLSAIPIHLMQCLPFHKKKQPISLTTTLESFFGVLVMNIGKFTLLIGLLLLNLNRRAVFRSKMLSFKIKHLLQVQLGVFLITLLFLPGLMSFMRNTFPRIFFTHLEFHLLNLLILL